MKKEWAKKLISSLCLTGVLVMCIPSPVIRAESLDSTAENSASESGSFDNSASENSAGTAEMKVGERTDISDRVADELPYDTYNYDYYGDVKMTPAAYIPESTLRGNEWGIGSLSSPQDMNVSEAGMIYIADTGNNRIVELDENYGLLKVYDHFDNNGTADTFNAPYGVYCSLNNNIYIADTGNKRVVELDAEGNLVQILEDPQSEVLGDNFDFAPLKVAVDYADRVYVIAKNMFEGIMAFDTEGNFTGFTGTINVQVTAAEKIWRRFTTKEQRSRQQLFIPTEFTGMEIDAEGFIYATNVDPDGIQSVRRLNPKGQDVIVTGADGTLSGDLDYRIKGDYSGPSRIIDVVVREEGIYSIIDATRGRIFTYDHEGDLLYIFGGIGTQEGTFKQPTAIDHLGDKILVLDGARNALMSFIPTTYGSLINQAVGLRYDGKEAEAVECWKQVIKLDSNFELAYTGIGKSYLASGENALAMKYFKLGKNRTYYSIAFKRFRNDYLKNHLQYYLSAILLLIIGLKIRSILCQRHSKDGGKKKFILKKKNKKEKGVRT